MTTTLSPGIRCVCPTGSILRAIEIVPLLSFIRFLPVREPSDISILKSRLLETYGRVRSWRLFVDRPIDWLALVADLLWESDLVIPGCGLRAPFLAFAKDSICNHPYSGNRGGLSD